MRLRRKKITKAWREDLAAVQNQTLPFDTFVRRHSGVIRKMASRWMSRVPPSVTIDDLVQEALLVLHDSVLEWKHDGGATLVGWVRRQITYRFKRLMQNYDRASAHEGRFASHLIVQECVIFLPSSNPMYEAGGRADYPEVWEFYSESTAENDCDAKTRVSLAVSSLPSKQAQYVAGVILGHDPEVVAERVYGGTLRPRKAGLRAIAAAIRAVEPSESESDPEPEEHHHAENENDQHQVLRPLRNVRPDVGERHSALVG